jgi:hypothetical protein
MSVCVKMDGLRWFPIEGRFTQTRKPDSVLAHHLSSAAYPSGKNEQLLNPDLFGLAARKVYPTKPLPTQRVSSYLTFSPLPPDKQVAVVFCGTCCCQGIPPLTPVFAYGTVLCAVWTFLPPKRAVSRSALQS